MIDGFSPWFDPERDPPRSWAMPYAHLDQLGAPYVRADHLDRAVERFARYCDRVAAAGYTHVFVGNLIHLATFDRLADPGQGPIYAPDSPFRARGRAYQSAFARAAKAAQARGLRLVVETDFPTWTPELLDWLGPQGTSLENERLWAATRAALEELFTDVGAAALIVRIGEGGGAYDEATGYASGVRVRTVEDAQLVLRRLLDLVADHNARTGAKKRLIFRTWTIGVGEIGALHTNPELYERVLRPFYGREELIVSIKHVAMDFFAHAPPNPTIGAGQLPQLVELQARREYEGFGLFPNYRAAEVREHLTRFAASPTFRGINVWPINGGFLLPARNYYTVSGPEAWVDGNVHAYGRLLANPQAEPAALAEEWARDQGLSPADARAVAAILLRSQAVVDRGLYLRPYATRAPALFGLDVFPTMLWVYWNRPMTTYGIQGLVARRALDDLSQCYDDGAFALAELDRSLAEAEALSPSALRDELLAALRYQRSLFDLLDAYRHAYLEHHAWALRGEAGAYDRWRAALPRLEAAADAHVKAYAGDPHLPAYDLREVRRLLRDDARYPALRLAAVFLALVELLLAGAFLSLLRPGRPAPPWLGTPPATPLAACAACAVIGAAAAVFVGLEAALLVAGLKGGAVATAYGLAVLVFARLRGPSAARLAPTTAALVPLAPGLVIQALLLLAFAVGGPAWVHGLWIDPLLGASWLPLLLLLGGWAVGEVAVTLLAARAAVPPQRAAGAAALHLALLVALGLLFLGLARERGLLWGARTARLAPSILNEAGTYVEDLVD
jgi:hypothetical protein